MGRKNKKTVAEKYIFKTVNHGKIVWVVCTYDVKKQQQRRQFSNLKAAKAFLSNLQDGQRFDIADFARMPINKISDIREALTLLPDGRSLKEAVLKAFGNDTKANLDQLCSDFKSTESARGLSERHLKQIKSRIDTIAEHFKSFDNINESSIFKFISSKGTSRKTVENWYSDFDDFFKFCIRKDAIKFNPFDKISVDDFGRAKKKPERKFISVDTANDFILYIQSHYPQYLKYYVLCLFSGIRVSEIERCNENFFDYVKKSISLPSEITKEARSEYLTDFEPNLWEWLDILKCSPIVSPSSNTRQRIFKKFNLPQNFARHSFATYHYSLYRDPKRTATLTHHTEQQLMNNYMGALVDKKIARQYFEIKPI